MTTAEYRSRYACTDIEEYEFACSVADCPEVSHESEDFRKCESCACLLCDEHAQYMCNDAVTPFCSACSTCACGQEAAFHCDECGCLKCWNCIYRHDDIHESLFGGVSITNCYYCRPCFLQTEDSPLQIETEEPCRHHASAMPAAEVSYVVPF